MDTQSATSDASTVPSASATRATTDGPTVQLAPLALLAIGTQFRPSVALHTFAVR